MENEKNADVSPENETNEKIETKEKNAGDCCQEECQCGCTPERKKMMMIIAAIIVVAIILVGYKYKGSDFKSFFQHKKVLTVSEAKSAALDFINGNLVQAGTKVDITGITAEGSLYKMEVDVAGQKITAYMTNDGGQFFPTGMDMKATAKTDAVADNSQATPAVPVPKNDKPNVKLFVMSYCPYGTQIEKGILPAVAALGNKINFTLEFVDYSMHNDHATGDRKELDENLRQYCIQKLQPTKLATYLTCFLKAGKGTEDTCMTQSGVTVAPVNSCMTEADAQFNVTKDFNDQSSYKGQFPIFEVNAEYNTKYSVAGSPTLVINDTTANAAGRDSASLLKTICSAFNTEPKECQTQLSGTAPAAGFGDAAGSAAASSASCGS